MRTLIIFVEMYYNQINVRAFIGQSAVAYCASKPIGNSQAIDHKFLWFI